VARGDSGDDLQAEAFTGGRLVDPAPRVADDDAQLVLEPDDEDLDLAVRDLGPVRMADGVRHRLADAEADVVRELVGGERRDCLGDRGARDANARGDRRERQLEALRGDDHDRSVPGRRSGRNARTPYRRERSAAGPFLPARRPVPLEEP
jgi:hypothetical protein